MNDAPRCLVVEDERLLAELMAENLAADGWSVETESSGRRALQRIGQGGLDLIVLDIMLPELDGFGVLQAVREAGDSVPVLVVSARSTDGDRIRGLELQADDYLVKPFNLREFLLRCRALLRRSRESPPPQTFEIDGNRIDFAARELCDRRGEHTVLTPAEFGLLRMLVQRPNQVVPRREIVAALFGPNESPKHRTVDNLVLRLRRLIERDPANPRLLLTVRGVGLRLVIGGD